MNWLAMRAPARRPAGGMDDGPTDCSVERGCVGPAVGGSGTGYVDGRMRATRNTEHQHSSSVPPACSSRPAGGPTGSRHRRCMGMAARFRLGTQHAQYRHECTARLSTPRPARVVSSPLHGSTTSTTSAASTPLSLCGPRVATMGATKRRNRSNFMVREKQLSPSSSVHAAVESTLRCSTTGKSPPVDEQRADAVRLPGSLRILFTVRFKSVRWPLAVTHRDVATPAAPHH